MQPSRPILFLISACVLALVLGLSSVREPQVAALVLTRNLRQALPVQSPLSHQCSTLSWEGAPSLSPLFRAYEGHLGASQLSGEAACEFKMAIASQSRFHLRADWNVLPWIERKGERIWEGSAQKISFPLPLVFLPLLLFLLSIFMPVPFWGVWGTLASYVLLLSGGNLIELIKRFTQASSTTISTDQTYLSLTLILLWTTLYRHSGETIRREKQVTPSWQRNTNRLLALTIGLWSPAFYTLMGKVFYPWKARTSAQLPFLHAQVLVGCFSLYLLSLQWDWSSLPQFLQGSLLLPRYFSFSVILLLGLALVGPKVRAPVTLWTLPRFWPSLLTVGVVEGLAWVFPTLREFPTLMRVGFALTLSELFRLRRIPVRPIWYQFFPVALLLLAVACVSAYAAEQGMLDLALVLWDPAKHPTGYVLFTFIGGCALGFLTGSFSTTFVALFSLLMSSYQTPLVKAALLDGVLAGSLLSPLSLYNLIPMMQFSLPLPDLVAFRFKQLALPIAIGAIIYALSAVNSVAILRPATFLFLCLVVFVIQLRRSDWHFGKWRAIFG